jgi:hypothetical protein
MLGTRNDWRFSIMRTEITVPFAFDTTPIEMLLQEHGMEEAMKVLERLVKENLESQLPKRRDYYGNELPSAKPDWKKLAEDLYEKFLEKHMEEIIDEAALLLAMKATRKKQWREVLRELKEQEGQES